MDDLHIFGASGAVGSHLVARLRAEQRPATAWTHRTPAPAGDAGNGIAWRRSDLWRDTDPSSAATVISTGPLDAFAAWLQRVDTPRLQRVVALSSMSIISKRDAADPDERALAERLERAEQSLRDTCATRGIAWTILRPTLIWGASRDLSLTPLYRFARRYGFVPVPMAAGGLRQPVHVDDVVGACVIAMSHSACIGRVFALGGGECLSAAAMWKRSATCAEARVFRVPIRLLNALSYALGARGAALRAALSRWHADQTVVESSVALPGWTPRGFLPTTSDFLSAGNQFQDRD